MCVLHYNVFNFRCFSQLKSYSQYAPFFVEPIFDKEKQSELFETGEAKKLAHIPFKAAYNSHTCSIFYDEIVRYFCNIPMLYILTLILHL